MGERRSRNEVHALIVLHGAVHNDAAMAVGGIFAQADVRDHLELRYRVFNGTNCLLDDPVRVVGVGAHLVLLGGEPEDQDGGNAQAGHLLRLRHDRVDGEVIAARHGGDLLPHATAGRSEERIDKAFDGELRLADHVAERPYVSETAHPRGWKGRRCRGRSPGCRRCHRLPSVITLLCACR